MSLALGVPHPDMLLGILSARQLREWELYADQEPFGTPADDVRTALLRSTVATAAGLKKKVGAFTLPDFMPVWSADSPYAPKAETADERANRLLGTFAAITQKARGRDLRQQKGTKP